MPVKTLTQKFVDKAKVPSGERKIQYRDSKIVGLYVELLSSGSGSYYYCYKRPDGTKKNKRLGDYRKLKLKDARKAVNLIVGNIAKGIYPETREELKQKQAELRKHDITVSDAYETEYQHHIEAKISSYADTHGRFRNHILPVLGKKKLIHVKRSEIERFLNESKSKRNFKNSTLNRLHADIHSFFTYFVDHDDYLLEKNPAAKIKKYKEEEKEYRELSAEEFEALLKACRSSANPYLYHIVKLWMYTGARRNEVLNAKWDDFNLESRQWTIARNKQNKLDRKVLSDQALAAIKEIPKVPGSEYLFPQKNNLRKPVVNVFYAFESAKKEAGITKVFTPHDFRHQYATTLIREGVDVSKIQALLGHSRLNTTLRYARLDHQSLVDAANVFGNKFARDEDTDQAA